MRRIYSHEAYYERVKLLLSRSRPTSIGRFTFATCAHFSLRRAPGVLSSGRLSYWRFVLSTALRTPRSFGKGMTLAVMATTSRS